MTLVRRLFLGGLAALAMLPLGVSAPAGAQTVTLKLGHILPVDSPDHRAFMFMADRVKALTNGEVAIQIFPASQLGAVNVMMEGLQAGSLDMATIDRVDRAAASALAYFERVQLATGGWWCRWNGGEPNATGLVLTAARMAGRSGRRSWPPGRSTRSSRMNARRPAHSTAARRRPTRSARASRLRTR